MKPKAKKAKVQAAELPALFPACLRSTALFSNLSQAEIACFEDAAHFRTYRKRKILYVEGEAAEFFYIICDGWIKLFHTLPEGEEVIVDMLTSGHMVGEGSIFEEGRHTCTAEVIEDVRLLGLPTSLLKEQINHSPALAFSMLSSMFRHHRRHYGELALNAMQSAPQRIGGFLLRLCQHERSKSATIHLPYDKALIAYTLGMKGSTFSRALNVLRQKAAIEIIGSRVEVASIDRLIKFVHGPLAAKYMPPEM